jgi:dTDP-glucose 4,6-dehydratase
MKIERKIQNILVTGGMGFIGSAFIRYLLQKAETMQDNSRQEKLQKPLVLSKGFSERDERQKKEFSGKVFNLDLLTYAADKSNLTSIEKDPRYRFIQGDIQDQELLEEIIEKEKIDAIVHFAAETHVDRSIVDPKVFLETNIFGTFSLLEITRKNPQIHFHHISTDEVYGSLGKEGFFTEESIYKPNSPYSASKAASDHFVRAYHKTYHLSTTVSHCTNNYGPCQYPEKIIPLMLLHCLEGKQLPIYGKGDNIRDWLYVEDHAEGIFQILQYGQSGEVYDLGGGEEKKNLDLVYLLIKILSEELHVSPEVFTSLISFVKDRSGHDFRYAMEGKKMKEELGWEPSHTLEAGLRKTIKWYLYEKGWSKKFSGVFV